VLTARIASAHIIAQVVESASLTSNANAKLDFLGLTVPLRTAHSVVPTMVSAEMASATVTKVSTEVLVNC